MKRLYIEGYSGSGRKDYIDLRIKNDTGSNYQLAVWVRDSDLNGEWRSISPSPFRYRVYETDHRITGEWWGGYIRHNILKRTIYNEEGLIKDEVVAREGDMGI